MTRNRRLDAFWLRAQHEPIAIQVNEMSVARHKRDTDVEGLSLEEIMQRYVGRFTEKK